MTDIKLPLQKKEICVICAICGKHFFAKQKQQTIYSL
jgi:hypothetical protein